MRLARRAIESRLRLDAVKLARRCAGVMASRSRNCPSSNDARCGSAANVNRCPVAAITFASVAIVGFEPPRSSRAIADCVSPARDASSACVSAASVRAARIKEAADVMNII